ncbi:hypothetical protein CFP71_18945 [Amycolatopsis thailandensis]|uniref:Uncharacterized protein n=1 Tax=Amycolatopsis thailandensis TaxID=589330 RepID=A0A229S7Y8_9PSEU|nr:hypothetical protein CFP71_18945 [Amycolatopsis thailandensis]
MPTARHLPQLTTSPLTVDTPSDQNGLRPLDITNGHDRFPAKQHYVSSSGTPRRLTTSTHEPRTSIVKLAAAGPVSRHVLTTIGAVLAVMGVVLAILGGTGRKVDGRARWF